jgi:hypothetical protein
MGENKMHGNDVSVDEEAFNERAFQRNRAKLVFF